MWAHKVKYWPYFLFSFGNHRKNENILFLLYACTFLFLANVSALSIVGDVFRIFLSKTMWKSRNEKEWPKNNTNKQALKKNEKNGHVPPVNNLDLEQNVLEKTFFLLSAKVRSFFDFKINNKVVLFAVDLWILGCSKNCFRYFFNSHLERNVCKKFSYISRAEFEE